MNEDTDNTYKILNISNTEKILLCIFYGETVDMFTVSFELKNKEF